MAQPLKYEFAPFNGSGAGADAGRPRVRRLGEDEIERIREAAFEEGRARGASEAEADLARRKADAFDALAGAVGGWSGGLDAARAELGDGAAAVALAVGRAIAGVAVARAPLDVIRPLVAEALDCLGDDARLVIDVHEAIVDIVETEVASLAADAGFAGRVRVRAADGNVADCRIDWGEGGIERRVGDITAAIADRLAAHGIALPPAAARAGEM